MKKSFNPVAKNAFRFNKSKRLRGREKDPKRGYVKHKGRLLAAGGAE